MPGIFRLREGNGQFDVFALLSQNGDDVAARTRETLFAADVRNNALLVAILETLFVGHTSSTDYTRTRVHTRRTKVLFLLPVRPFRF